MNNKYEGDGVLVDYPSQQIVEGQFSDHKMNGNVKITNLIGEHIYTGEMKNSLENGTGLKTSDGLDYQGEFLEGKKHGMGKLIDTKNDVIFEGEFTDDHPSSKYCSIAPKFFILIF